MGAFGAHVTSISPHKPDFIASFAAMFGQEIPANHAIDSRNTLPALLGDDPHGLPFMIEEADTIALREGPWKFVLRPAMPAGDELFHLEKDIGEQTNIVANHPQRAAAMKTRLLAIRDARHGIRSFETK